METVTHLWQLAQDPLVLAIILGVLALVKVAATYLVKSQPKASELANELYNLSQQLEPWVRQAEVLFLREGKTKPSYVFDEFQKWCEENDVHGEKKAALVAALPALMEVAVKDMQLKKI